MAQRCATLAEFLRVAPEFLNVGLQSTGVLNINSQPSIGDTIVLAQVFGNPGLQILTAEQLMQGQGQGQGNPQILITAEEFDIGEDTAETAANIAIAINLFTLATATSIGSVVFVTSADTGARGTLTTLSSASSMLWDAAILVDGTDTIDFYLDCACAQINLECWGDKADCAHIFLTGHFLATAGYGSGEGGAVSAKSIDKLSVSMATSASSDVDYGSTKWGRQYIALKKTILIVPIVGRC